jgi:hypothetical protein
VNTKWMEFFTGVTSPCTADAATFPRACPPLRRPTLSASAHCRRYLRFPKPLRAIRSRIDQFRFVLNYGRFRFVVEHLIRSFPTV